MDGDYTGDWHGYLYLLDKRDVDEMCTDGLPDPFYRL